MTYDAEACTVAYTSDKPSRPTAGCRTFDALDFVALVATQVPDKGQVLERYYGHYSSRARGMRRKAAEAAPDAAAAAFGTPADVSLSGLFRTVAARRRRVPALTAPLPPPQTA
jgi:hypothetical protein